MSETPVERALFAATADHRMVGAYSADDAYHFEPSELEVAAAGMIYHRKPIQPRAN